MTIENWHDHALSRVIVLPPKSTQLLASLRQQLVAASDSGRLKNSPSEIFQLIKMLPEPPSTIANELRSQDLYSNASCIVGGEKNFRREPEQPHFTRDDGAWFDFTITVRERSRQLDLLAYGFEIRFPPGPGVPFLRLDLNVPSHRNEERALRSHLHLGTDDVQMPAPMFNPTEALSLFVDGLRADASRARSRRPTAFEIDWLRDTHALLPAK